MIITCQNCKTQYAVPSEAIPAQGKKVKCSNCGNVWLQQPLEVLVDTSVIAPPPPSPKPVPVPPHANLPAVKKISPAPKLLKAACLVFMVLAGASWVLAHHEKLPPLEKIAGMESMDGVVFKNFSALRKRIDNKLQFAVEGDISNEAATPRPLSPIRIEVVTKGGRIMNTVMFEPKVNSLQPGETLHIEPVIENVSGSADKVVLDMGNKWEMMFR